MNLLLLKILKSYKKIRHFFGKRKYSFFANRGDVFVKEKIVVFESDDWGTLRMFNSEKYFKLSEVFGQSDDPFVKFDSLETEEDVTALINVLSKHFDSRLHTPVFTLNYGLRSPDFKRIIDSDYKTFYSLSLSDSYLFSKKETAFNVIKKGITQGLFYPQLHTLFHINALEWMKSLSDNMYHKIIVDNYCIDYSCLNSEERPFLFMDEMRDVLEKDINKYILEANSIFKEEFGFYSNSFIPCCNVINSEKDNVFSNTFVQCVQGSPYYFSFNKKTKKYNKHLRKWKRSGIVHLVRNCLFEPSINGEKNSIIDCMWQINKAFKKNKPAVICTHRLNYIGSISLNNRLDNINALDILLTEIEKKYPDVIYMSSDELYRRIKNDH